MAKLKLASLSLCSPSAHATLCQPAPLPAVPQPLPNEVKRVSEGNGRVWLLPASQG